MEWLFRGDSSWKLKICGMEKFMEMHSSASRPGSFKAALPQLSHKYPKDSGQK
jgi:hypothetical protein